MSDEPLCENPACGHTEDDHDEYNGMCLARGCKCVCWRYQEWDDDEDDPEPLDFYHGAA